MGGTIRPHRNPFLVRPFRTHLEGRYRTQQRCCVSETKKSLSLHPNTSGITTQDANYFLFPALVSKGNITSTLKIFLTKQFKETNDKNQKLGNQRVYGRQKRLLLLKDSILILIEFYKFFPKYLNVIISKISLCHDQEKVTKVC